MFWYRMSRKQGRKETGGGGEEEGGWEKPARSRHGSTSRTWSRVISMKVAQMGAAPFVAS
jgi:hypothetical protein